MAVTNGAEEGLYSPFAFDDHLLQLEVILVVREKKAHEGYKTGRETSRQNPMICVSHQFLFKEV